jgi:CHAT domain-containing protein
LGSFGGIYSQAGSVNLLVPNGTLRVTGTIPNLITLAPNGTPVDTGSAAGASVYSGSPNTIFINLLNSPSLPFVVGNSSINGTAGRLQTPTESVINRSFNFLFRSPGQTIGIGLPQAPPDPIRPDPCILNPNSCTPPINDPDRPNGNQNPLSPGLGQPVTPLARLERNNCLEFQRYFGPEFSRLVGDRNPCDQQVTVAGIQAQLRQIEQETGQKSTIIYIAETPGAIGISAFFSEGEPVTRTVNNVGQLQLEALANELREEVAPLTAGGSVDASALGTDSYLLPAQRLHQALIAPIAADLEARGIQVLVFSMGRGLRGIPMAALHDGKQFLIEKYAVALIPSLNLTQVSYGKNLRGSRMLAMGASEWESRGVKGVPDLPSVPTELSLISQTSGLPTQTYLNPGFTTGNLVQQRGQPVRVVHLATHGEFLAGQPNQSFIRFWDNNVNLAEMRQLQLNAPEVDLLTLSACQTAAGDEQAELGFAGMALAAGVKTTVASLWYVSDVSTMAMMSSFYSNLQTASTKAQALRQTQIAMLRGQVRLEGNQLLLGTQSLNVPPDQAQMMNRQLTQLRVRDFRHPYFWSAFTMVGSPW